MCDLPEVGAGRLDFTQLFVNGKRQIRARFPNYDHKNPLVSGTGYINAAGKERDWRVQTPLRPGGFYPKALGETPGCRGPHFQQVQLGKPAMEGRRR